MALKASALWRRVSFSLVSLYPCARWSLITSFSFSPAVSGSIFEYAISEENDCLVCSTYFRKLLKDNGIDFDNFQFTKKEELLISFGRALAKDPKNIPDEIYSELKEEFTEEEIVVIGNHQHTHSCDNYDFFFCKFFF